MRALEKYIKLRGGTYYYQRRVPIEYQDFDNRLYVKKSLKTKSLEVARARRDSLVEADNLYWASISSLSEGFSTNSLEDQKTARALKRYQAAKRRAMSKGFLYTPNEELLAGDDLSELMKRLDALPDKKLPNRNVAEALLGVVEKPRLTIIQAFDLYCNEIAVSDLIGKSATQARDWKKIKNRAVLNFTRLCGNMPMDKITRDEARKFYNWWANKLKPVGDSKGLSPNSANRDIGNLRKLYRCYWEYEGEESRQNPFRNLNFKDTGGKDVGTAPSLPETV